MKIFRVFLIFVCVCAVFSFAGCGERELPSAQIVRDDARTGGSLSFVYDKNDRMVYIGGEDEYIQFSSADEITGLSEGHRVGLKVIAPDESLDLTNARLEMNSVNYSADDFLASVNGQKQRFFVIKPIFSEQVKEACFTVTWEDGTKEQEYKIIIKEGTKFVEKTEE